MDNELRYLLEQGPTTVKELSRLSGKSTSTLYNVLKDPAVKSKEGKDGKLFFVEPSGKTQENAVEAPRATGNGKGTPSAQKTAAVSPGPSKRGRKPTFAGKTLHPTATLLVGDSEPKTYTNNRRKGSHGYKSLQIILKQPGITTEDYVAKGGRLNDLRWDIDHGAVSAE